MIVSMDQLVRQRILHVLPVDDLVGANPDACIRREAAAGAVRAPTAADVGFVDRAVELGDLFSHETDDGACSDDISGERHKADVKRAYCALGDALCVARISGCPLSRS